MTEPKEPKEPKDVFSWIEDGDAEEELRRQAEETEQDAVDSVSEGFWEGGEE